MCRACWLRIAFSFAAYGAWLLCSAKAFRCSSLERQWFVREFPEGFHRTLLSSVECSKTPRRLFVLRREAWAVFVSPEGRFRDRDAGATPGAGVAADAGGARRSHRLQPSRRRRTRQSRVARCPRLWFVVKKRLILPPPCQVGIFAQLSQNEKEEAVSRPLPL